jgi:DNA-binding response OmpR family regulator
MSRAAKILVVDDEAHLADGIRENLAAEGYQTVVAYDGAAGFGAATAERFDLVIVDVMMPKMDGLEVCASLRRDGVQTPVLFLTVKGAPEDRVRGFEAGGASRGPGLRSVRCFSRGQPHSWRGDCPPSRRRC